MVRAAILQFVIDVMIGTKTVGEKRPHIILTYKSKYLFRREL
jgi:hypothetical protein